MNRRPKFWIVFVSAALTFGALMAFTGRHRHGGAWRHGCGAQEGRGWHQAHPCQHPPAASVDSLKQQ